MAAVTDEEHQSDAATHHQQTNKLMTVTSSAQNEVDSLEGEVILRVILYSSNRSGGVRRPIAEFDVLGSQKLTALKDHVHFSCMHDYTAEGQVNVSSSSFFIEGVFYDDTRDASALRYSKYV